MTRVAVSRLRLRGPPDGARRGAWRAEQALRLAAPEGERLLVLRRLSLGRLPVAGAPALWDARAGAALREAGARALHALAPGAALANAVWFASAAEARLLLLRELAAGRRAEAWFWRLAVPDWRGASLPEWVPRLIAQALVEPETEIALARAVLRLAEEGHLAPLLAALDAAPEPPRASTLRPIGAAARSSPAIHATPAGPLALRLLSRLAPSLRAQLHVAMRARPQPGRAARWLARLALLSVAPEAAAQPGLLAAMADAVLAGAPPGIAVPPAPEPAQEPAPAQDIGVAEARPSTPHAPTVRLAPNAPASPPEVAQSPPPAPPPDRRAPSRTASPPRVAITEPRGEAVFTRAGGLLLLVWPLARMGLPAWLERHPDLAAAGFARALLHQVALRQRIARGDPLVALLGEAAMDHPALDAWRVGLDRWLRRRVRRSLAQMARRHGWLTIAEDRLALRFPADAADLNLRRLALDTDPGWVPWLGLAIRYDFRDHPAP